MVINMRTIIFCLLGFIFVSIFGTISHFFYFWSGKNKVIGILFPANESTWEHLKLSIFPTLIYFLVGFIAINNNNYIFSFFTTLVVPIILIPLIFYSYTYFTKKSILIVDILIFYLTIFLAFLICYFILNFSSLNNIINFISIIGILFIIICYLTFTLFPPKIFLFKDPITGNYGLIK